MIELVKYHNCIGFVCFRVVKCIIRNGYLMIENYVLYVIQNAKLTLKIHRVGNTALIK